MEAGSVFILAVQDRESNRFFGALNKDFRLFPCWLGEAPATLVIWVQ